MFKKIAIFFDKLEDKVRGRLSHKPILYAFVGGVGVVLFWRGVWHTADWLSYYFLHRQTQLSPLDLINLTDGLLSLVIGTVLLLMTGLFVSTFIGNEIIISGIKGEKKLTERTEEEITKERVSLQDIRLEVKEIKEILQRKK
jgi:MFS superfamily sulfate permease-like transporter